MHSETQKGIDMDFEVENHGTVWLLTPKSQAAHEFITNSVDVPSWAFMGASVAVEHRCVEPLLNGIEREGLTYEGAGNTRCVGGSCGG